MFVEFVSGCWQLYTKVQRKFLESWFAQPAAVDYRITILLYLSMQKFYTVENIRVWIFIAWEKYRKIILKFVPWYDR